MSVLRNLYQYLEPQLEKRNALNLGKVREKSGSAIIEGSDGWFGLNFTLRRVSAKEPSPETILPPPGSSDEDETEELVPRQMGTDLGVRHKAELEESDDDRGTPPLGVLLSSRRASNSHTQRHLEREPQDLSVVRIWGKVDNGPEVYAKVRHRYDGRHISASFFNFPEETLTELLNLMHLPFTESVPLLELRQHEVLMTSAPLSFKRQNTTLRLKKGIHFLFEGRAPSWLRDTQETDADWLDFHGKVPEDLSSNMDFWSAPLFFAKFDDLKVENAFFRIHRCKDNTDAEWDDEDGGFWIANAILRGAVKCDDKEVPTYAILVPGHHTLVIRDTGKRLPTAPLSAFDTLVGNSRWREVLPDPLQNAMASLVTWNRNVDLLTQVHSSSVLEAKIGVLGCRQRDGRVQWRLNQPTLRWIVGFPRQAPGPQVHCSTRADLTLTLNPPDGEPVRLLFKDVGASFHDGISVKIGANLSSEEVSMRLAAAIGVDPLITGDISQGPVRLDLEFLETRNTLCLSPAVQE